MSMRIPVNMSPKTNTFWDNVGFRVISAAGGVSVFHACQHNLQLFSHKKCLLLKKMLVLRQSTERHSVLVNVTLILSDNNSGFGCSNSQKSRGLSTGDREGRLTAPARPVRCRPEVCFRCSQTLRRRLKTLVYSDPGFDWQLLEQKSLSGYSSKTRKFWNCTHYLWGEKLEVFWHTWKPHTDICCRDKKKLMFQHELFFGHMLTGTSG